MEIARSEIMAADPTIEVIGGYLSPVHDKYAKPNLASAAHRVAMTRAALQDSTWIMCGDWEAEQPEYNRTYFVLLNARKELPGIYVRLVLGADVLLSMQMEKPGPMPGTMIPVWTLDTLQHLLEEFNIAVLNRDGGTTLDAFFGKTLVDEASDIRVEFAKYQHKFLIMAPHERNDLSSTYVRANVAAGRSNKYLMPDDVITYIAAKMLYGSKV